MKNILIPILAFLLLLFFCVIAVIFNVLSLKDLPASFIGAALGAIIVVIVTTLLLKAQSQAEEVKDRNAKVFEKKSVIFQQYIKSTWKIWEDHRVSADEFQKLTSDFYSNLMIYLQDKSIDKISDCLLKISKCIDKEDVNHELLRENVIDIINTLSDEIKLGGHINIEKVKLLDSEVFPLLFKKTLIYELKEKMMKDTSLFNEPKLVRAYSKNNEYLQFVFKDYHDCKISIGPFNVVGRLKIGLDINKKLHQFDKYRQKDKYSYWIVLNYNGKSELFLNEILPQDPQDEETKDIELNNLGKIESFGFKDNKSLIKYEGNYQKLCILLAQRAAYYLNTITINNEYSIAEFPKAIIGENKHG